MITSSLVMRSISSLAVAILIVGSAVAAKPPIVRTKQSGALSANETWNAGRATKTGEWVVIRMVHQVIYDVESKEAVREDGGTSTINCDNSQGG